VWSSRRGDETQVFADVTGNRRTVFQNVEVRTIGIGTLILRYANLRAGRTLTLVLLLVLLNETESPDRSLRGGDCAHGRDSRQDDQELS